MMKLVRSNWLLAVALVLCAALAVVTLRATAQQPLTGPRLALAPAEQPPGTPSSTPSPEGAPAPAAPAPSVPPPAAPEKAPPGKPAGSRDDATVAPDKGQSADNNVSFPTDI